MNRTFETLGNDTGYVIFDNMGFQAYGNCRERSSSPLRIMQIVTSAVLFRACLLSCEYMTFRLNRILASGWVSFADFSGFICKMEHPLKAEK